MSGTGAGDGFWKRLSETERAQLSAIGRLIHYPPGTVVCNQGEPATHMIILMNGWVKVTAVSREGQESVLALRGQGELIGELGEVSGYRTATVRAISLVESLLVLHTRFSEFLGAHPQAGRTYVRIMTQRWGDANTALLDRSTTTGAQRLAGQLLDLAERHGTGQDGRVIIEMPLSQSELASLVGTSRSTLARALASWRDRGFVQTSYRHIAITNADGLRRIAHRPTTSD